MRAVRSTTLLPPQRKASWLASMRAAGVEPDDATIERVDRDIAVRIRALDELLSRLDFHNSNPDYLRSRVAEEAGNGDA